MIWSRWQNGHRHGVDPDCPEHGCACRRRQRSRGGSRGGWFGKLTFGQQGFLLLVVVAAVGSLVSGGGQASGKPARGQAGNLAGEAAGKPAGKPAGDAAGEPEQAGTPSPQGAAAAEARREAGWSPAGLAEIPAEFRGHYSKAAKTCPRLTPWLLAGIGRVESDHGQSRAPGVHSGVNRFGCCAGPMQFNLTDGPPSTWDSYGRPGDSPYDPADAIGAAARKLCHDGLGSGAFAATWAGRRGGDLCPQLGGSAAAHRALRRYNNECDPYARLVLAFARRYAPDGRRVA